MPDPILQESHFAMIYNLRQQRSARTATQASIRSRPITVPGIRDATAESTRDARDEPALKLPMLEAEVVQLRQSLADATANRDELRQEMDDLRRDRRNRGMKGISGRP